MIKFVLLVALCLVGVSQQQQRRPVYLYRWADYADYEAPARYNYNEAPAAARYNYNKIHGADLQEQPAVAPVMPEARIFDFLFATEYKINTTITKTVTKEAPKPCLVPSAFNDPKSVPSKECEKITRRRSLIQDEEDDQLEELTRFSRQAADYGESSIYSSLSAPTGTVPRQARQLGTVTKTINLTITETQTKFVGETTSDLGQLKIECLPIGFKVCTPPKA